MSVVRHPRRRVFRRLLRARPKRRLLSHQQKDDRAEQRRAACRRYDSRYHIAVKFLQQSFRLLLQPIQLVVAAVELGFDARDILLSHSPSPCVLRTDIR